MLVEGVNKMEERLKSKKKFFMFLLIYFVLFTLCFSLITLAKYVGSSTGSGNATVAKWSVSMDTSDNESDTLQVTVGNNTQTYNLTIESTSDTKALYSIVLSDLPNGLEVSLDGVNFVTAVNNEVTFDNVGYINANAQNKEVNHTLTFKAGIDSGIVDSDINIDVIFKQASPTSN